MKDEHSPKYSRKCHMDCRPPGCALCLRLLGAPSPTASPSVCLNMQPCFSCAQLQRPSAWRTFFSPAKALLMLKFRKSLRVQHQEKWFYTFWFIHTLARAAATQVATWGNSQSPGETLTGHCLSRGKAAGCQLG